MAKKRLKANVKAKLRREYRDADGAVRTAVQSVVGLVKARASKLRKGVIIRMKRYL